MSGHTAIPFKTSIVICTVNSVRSVSLPRLMMELPETIYLWKPILCLEWKTEMHIAFQVRVILEVISCRKSKSFIGSLFFFLPLTTSYDNLEV